MMDLVVACIVILAVETALHYWPWSKVLSKPLGPPWSYVAGVLPILLVFTGWALTQAGDGYGQAVAALWVITAAAGAAVAGAYLLDWVVGLCLARRVWEARGDQEDDGPGGGGD